MINSTKRYNSSIEKNITESMFRYLTHYCEMPDSEASYLVNDLMDLMEELRLRRYASNSIYKMKMNKFIKYIRNDLRGAV